MQKCLAFMILALSVATASAVVTEVEDLAPYNTNIRALPQGYWDTTGRVSRVSRCTSAILGPSGESEVVTAESSGTDILASLETRMFSRESFWPFDVCTDRPGFLLFLR